MNLTIASNQPQPQPALMHPGIAVRDIVEARGLSRGDAAIALGVSQMTLSRIINCRASISTEMALKLEAFGAGPAYTWLVAQAAFDLAQRRNRESV